MQKSLFERIIIPIFISGLFVLGVSLIPAKEAKTDALEVNFLDVGQGDGALIKTKNNKYILVDGGPDKKVLTEMGKLMPPARREIEAVILTHPHADHAAGLNYVLDTYWVKKVYMTGALHTAPDYTEFLEKIRKEKIPAEKFYGGKEFEIDGAKFHALSPLKDVSGEKFKDLNYSSIAFQLAYEGKSILFLGDLPNEGQTEMMKNTALTASEAVKISHHGSKNGTSKELLNIIKPKFAIISVGVNNDFGHPAPSTLSLLLNINVLRTDKLGTIRFLLSKDGASLK